jgi:hypothetical protein
MVYADRVEGERTVEDKYVNQTREHPLFFDRTPEEEERGYGIPDPLQRTIESVLSLPQADQPVAQVKWIKESVNCENENDREYDDFEQRKHGASFGMLMWE